MDDNDNVTKNLVAYTKSQDATSANTSEAHLNRLHGNNNGHNIGRIKKRGTQIVARRCRSLEIDCEIGGACVRSMTYLLMFTILFSRVSMCRCLIHSRLYFTVLRNSGVPAASRLDGRSPDKDSGRVKTVEHTEIQSYAMKHNECGCCVDAPVSTMDKVLGQ